MKRLGLALFLFALLLPAVLWLAVSTEPGTRGLLRAVERLLPVHIEYGSGSLGGRLHLQSLRYEAGDLTLALQDISAGLTPICLWRGALCFQQLKIGSIDIDLPPGAGGDAPSQDPRRTGSRQSASSLVVFPLLLEVDALEVGSLRVRWSGGEWRQGSLRAGVRLHRSNIDVHRARIVEPQLVLRATDSVEATVAEPMTLPPVDLPLNLSIDALQLIRPAWDFHGARYQQDEISVQGQWARNTLQVDSLVISSGELGELSLQGELVFADNWPLAAEIDVNLAQPLRYSDLLGRSISLSASGDLSTLVLQLRYAGTVDVAAEARLDALDRDLPFSATITATSANALALSDLDGVPAQLQDVEVVFPLAMTVRGTLHSQQVELQGTASGLGYESLRIALAGEHDQEKIVITDLSLRDAASANALRATGEVLLSPGHSWSLALATSGLDIPPLDEAVRGRIDGTVELSGEVRGEQWQVRIVDMALQGRINDTPAAIRGFTGLDSQLRLSASDLQAEVNGARLSLQSPGDAAGPGHLHLHVEDIGRWQLGSSGRVELEAEVSSDREHIQLAGRLRNVRWSGLAFEQAALTGDYRPGADHAFALETTVSDVVYGDINFAEWRLSARGDAQKQSITLASRGDFQGELNVSGMVQGEQWQGALAPTRLRTPMGEWLLSEAVALRGSRTEQQLTLAPHCWRHEHAQLCPGSWTLGARGSGSLALDGDLKLLAALLPPDVELAGELNIQLAAQWAPDAAPRVTGSVQTGVVSITQRFTDEGSATFSWDRADATLRYTSTGLHLDMGVQRDNRNIVALDLLLPPDRENAITGSINVDRLQLAALQPFVPALSTLAGELSGGLSLAGTVDKPQGFGELVVTDGQLAVQGNPTQLESLDIHLDVRGTVARIRGTGILGGGELQLAGRVETEPAPRLELDIQGRDHSIFYPPSTRLQIAQTLQLTVQKNLLELAGELSVLEGRIEMEELPEDSVAISPSVVEVDADGRTPREELPFDVRMNVKIHIADRFTVMGNALQATLGGDLRVQQRPGQPLQLFGNLDTVSGEFRAYQTRLQLKRGTINFTGPPANPTLDVRAERHISSGDVTVGVRVQGPLEDELELRIYSDPSMSQADAMSYLIRGRGMDAGAALDGASAALSMASGVVNRSELVAELNRIPGLSHVEFGAQGSEADTAATVSGYLGERIYLSYGVGLYEPVNVLTARFYLRSRLWLEVVSSIENSLDLYYSFDID